MDGDELREKVESALAPLAFRPINATVDNGVVYLNGLVRSGAEREQAIRLAEQVKGVRKVVSYLEIGEVVPMNLERPGQPFEEVSLEEMEMGESIEPDMVDDIGTTDVMISASENEVFFPPTDPVVMPIPREQEGIRVLGGFSSTSDDRSETLNHPPKVYQSDDELAEDVRDALLRDASTTDLEIRVRVREGVVVLRGHVQSIEDADQAESVAASVPGVVEVREELEY